MDCLKTLAVIALPHLEAIYQVRPKVYEVGLSLSGHPAEAAQIAAEFSDLGRILFYNSGLRQVRFLVSQEEGHVSLHVDFSIHENFSDAVHLDSQGISLHSQRIADDWVVRKSYCFNRVQRTSVNLLKLEQILQAKTREELYNDLNVKNQQLQIEVEERKAAEDILRQAQQDLIASEKLAALGALVAGIAHEINTPVGIGVTAASHLGESISNFAALYRGGSMRRSDLEDFVESIGKLNGMVEENLNRASQLIRSFKEVAVDQTADDEREFVLKDYTEQVITSLSPKLRNRPVRISIDDIDPTIHLKTSAGPISQIFTNLIVNSLVHGFDPEQPGTINISAHKVGTDLKISYIDDGKGISAEHLKRIFDPFFTTKRAHGGSGLGMHLVYNIVTKKYSGKIRCESNPGHGVAFHMVLPALLPY